MALPSAAELVARYLKTNGYEETLRSFVQEAGLPSDIGDLDRRVITIEQIIQEKKTFDVSLAFEKLGVEEGLGWRKSAPSMPTVLKTLPTKSNILSVHVLDLILPVCDSPKHYLATTTADRRLNFMDTTDSTYALVKSYTHIQDSPILDLIVINKQHLLIASMSGKLVLYNTTTEKIINERKDHSKYLVKIARWCTRGETIIATAGWDSRIHFYRLETEGDHQPQLEEPFSSLTVPTIPETILFIKAPEVSLPLLLLTRRDSTCLFYYRISQPTDGDKSISLVGKQNLAPHSNAWVAFCKYLTLKPCTAGRELANVTHQAPTDVQLCPTDNTIAGIATSSTPHMKLLIVRLLIPLMHPSDVEGTLATSERTVQNTAFSLDILDAAPITQASQARADLLLQDREEAAILINVNTMSPQTAYSTPRLAWRPDGSGIYVSSDDGRIRGFEASSGKLIVNLDAHDPLSKIRCLWAGNLTKMPDTQSEETLISGGFDQKLIIWGSL